MNLSPPTTVVFIVSLILAALAVIGKFAPIPFITDHGFWVAIVAYVVLAVGNVSSRSRFTGWLKSSQVMPEAGSPGFVVSAAVK